MTTPGHELKNRFVEKWVPRFPDGTIHPETHQEFIRELDELRAAEFHGARQAMGREIVAKVVAITTAAAGIRPDYQPEAFRALGPWRTMTIEEAKRLVADENGQPRPVKVFQCSQCGAELASIEEAVTHPCETFEKTQHTAAKTEPIYLVNRTDE